MKIPRIANAINHIDDELVNSANRAESAKKNSWPWLRWVSVAACLAVLILAATAILSLFLDNTVSLSGTDGRDKDSQNASIHYDSAGWTINRVTGKIYVSSDNPYNPNAPAYCASTSTAPRNFAYILAQISLEDVLSNDKIGTAWSSASGMEETKTYTDATDASLAYVRVTGIHQAGNSENITTSFSVRKIFTPYDENGQ